MKVEQSATESEKIQKKTRTSTKEPHIGQYEPVNMVIIPPFLLNAVIDDEAGKVDIMALVHGIEVLETQINAITCPETRTQLEFMHLIKDPTSKKIWNPAMSTEVDRLVETKTIGFIKKRDIPS